MEEPKEQVTRNREDNSSKDERDRKRANVFASRSSSSAPVGLSFNFDISDESKDMEAAKKYSSSVSDEEYEEEIVPEWEEYLGPIKREEMDKKKEAFKKIGSSSALEGPILNVDERDKNNETGKMKGELLKEAARKSSSLPAKEYENKSHLDWEVRALRTVRREKMVKKKETFEKSGSSSALEGPILNVDERDENNETEKKKAELLKEAARKSSSLPAKEYENKSHLDWERLALRTGKREKINKKETFEKIGSSSAPEGQILNVYERDIKNEMDKKNAELLKEAMRKSSSSAPAKGMVTREVVIFKHPKNSRKARSPHDYKPTGYYKWFEDPPDDGTPIPDPPADYRTPVPFEDGPCGYLPLQLKGRDYRFVYAFAGEAVKEYNNRQLEDKDKLKLVKVTKVKALCVAGYRFDLTFHAKGIADLEEGRAWVYYASLWLKNDETLEVREFKLVDDGQGKEKLYWNNRLHPV